MKTILDKYRPVFNAEGGGDGGGADAGAAAASSSAGTVLGNESADAGGDKAGNIADEMYAGGDKKKDETGQDLKTKTPEEEAAAAKLKEEEAAAAKKKEDEGKSVEALKADDITFDLPEGFELDEAVANDFKAFAVENKLTLDQVKSLQSMQAKLYEKQTDAHAETVAKWGEDLKADKEIGGRAYDENIGYAKAAVQEFFSPEGLRMLDVTGLGNHPDIVKGFVRMGKAMGEGRSHKGNPGGSRTSIVDAMYGDS